MSSTVLTTDLEPIVEFQLKLADGSTVTIPCTAITHLDGTTALAAALHHLIQRVAYLESNQKEGTLNDV